MKIKNHSNMPAETLNIDEQGLEELIILPNHSTLTSSDTKGHGYLPNGTVAVYGAKDHQITSKALGPNTGCGLLIASITPFQDFEYSLYQITQQLKSATSEKETLGQQNHFIQFYNVEDSQTDSFKKGDWVMIVHCGANSIGENAYKNDLAGGFFYEEYQKAHKFGQANRKQMLDIVKSVTGTDVKKSIDLPHRTLEQVGSNIIYRNGAIKLEVGELAVIPSRINENAVIVRGTPELADLHNSMVSGTGRINKDLVDEVDLKKQLGIQYALSITENLPGRYRSMNDVDSFLNKYVAEVGTLKPIGFVN